MATPALAEDESPRIEEEIVVVGIFDEPDRVTGSAHRVGPEVIEAFRHDDVMRVLNFVPGVYAREEEGFGLRPNIGLRGGNSDRSQKVALMEDGILFGPAPYSAPAAYFFPLSARMENVEVFKGPSSIEYGPQTIGGAINMTSTPIPQARALEAAVGGGSDGYRQVLLRAGTRFENGGVLAEYVHIGTDGFKSIDNSSRDTGFYKNEALIKAEREIGDGLLEIRVGYADEVSDITYLGLTEADVRADPYRRYTASELDRMDWHQSNARISWSQPLLGGTSKTTAYVQNFDRAWRKFNNFAGADIREVLANPDSPFNQIFIGVLQGGDTDLLSGSPDDIRIGTNDRSFVSRGIQSTLHWNFGDDVEHHVTAGIRYHYDRIERLHDEFGFEQVNGAIAQNNQPRAILADNTGETDAISLWVKDEMVWGRWTIVPGLRIEHISNEFDNRLAGRRVDNDYTMVVPGVGASYAITDRFTVLGGIHRGFSPATPSLTEDLEPEESVNYEIGARWRSDFGQLELIGYFNDYDNLTAICTFSSGCAAGSLDTQTNAGEVRAYGVEAAWRHEFALNDGIVVPIGVTYTYTDAEFREGFSSTNPQFGEVEPGFELPYIPPHRANAHIGLEAEQWGLQLSITYVDRMRDQAGTGSFAAAAGSDASTIVDLAAHWKVNERWTVTGRVDNLTDEVDIVSRRPFGARTGKPLSVRVEVRYRLDG
ncbi:MAG: TonB-dependent receptor [Pseudomonadota bacterium]